MFVSSEAQVTLQFTIKATSGQVQELINDLEPLAQELSDSSLDFLASLKQSLDWLED